MGKTKKNKLVRFSVRPRIWSPGNRVVRDTLRNQYENQGKAGPAMFSDRPRIWLPGNRIVRRPKRANYEKSKEKPCLATARVFGCLATG